MKILKLLNKKQLSYFLITSFFLTGNLISNEPVDIWNLEKKLKKKIEINENKENKEENNKSIYDKQAEKIIKKEVQEEETSIIRKINIVGIYDPQEYDLTINMWENSDGEKIKKLYNKINKSNLSLDAREFMNIALLTNSYFPTTKILDKEFLSIKTKWLIKNNDFSLIKKYLIKNETLDENEVLIRFLVDQYLSQSELEKACEILLNTNKILENDYLSNFNIYCLINLNKRDEAQLQFDLKNESGVRDLFFERKFNYLMEYTSENSDKISEESILNFHLSHRTSTNFKFEPNEKTPKTIWRYLSTSNLLDSTDSIDIEDQKKINIIELATHDGNYKEEELYNLYKRFQFNINQLLTVKDSYKLLENVEAKALLYQGILINEKVEKKLELIKILKDLFLKEGIGNAYSDELSKDLKNLNKEEVPSNYTEFYEKYHSIKSVYTTTTKTNNKIIHQSKLLNYFDNKNTTNQSIEKELNDMLKKIKKSKDYNISTKDIIMLDSFMSDKVKISKKYENFTSFEKANIPDDIKILIDNQETGMILLRLAQIIGPDDLKDIGSETLYFIISTLNKLNMDVLRNKILLKTLPLKV